MFQEGDPRWIGAWWLGFPVIGLLILVFALPLMCFPQRLPKKGTDANLREEQARTEIPIKAIARGLGEDGQLDRQLPERSVLRSPKWPPPRH